MNNSRINVLVLDDEKHIRKNIKNEIKGSKVYVQCCFNLSDAVNGIDSGDYDILISDLEVAYRPKNFYSKTSHNQQNFIKSLNSNSHKVWNAQDVIFYASQNNMGVIIASSYKPGDLPSYLSEIYVQKKGNFYSLVKNNFSIMAKKISDGRFNSSNNLISNFLSKVNGLELKLSHLNNKNFENLDILKYLSSDLMSQIKDDDLSRLGFEQLKLEIGNLNFLINLKRRGNKLPINSNISKSNLEKYYNSLQNKIGSLDEIKMRELEIISKYI